MSEYRQGCRGELGHGGALRDGLSAAAVAAAIPSLAQLGADAEDAERIDRIRVLSELISAAAAARALETARFAASQRRAQALAGEPGERVGRGVASQVALAMRISPHRAQRYVGWATILTRELPRTFAVLQCGQTSEWRALIVARETIWLSREHRAEVDARLAGRMPGWGDRRVEAEARKIAYQLDPYGFMARTRGAENDRHVSLRPAPDAMARLSALLPVAQGVAVYAALTRSAASAAADGDPRGRGQVMADALVERVTGQATADAVPVEVNVVMTDETLLAGGAAAAHLDGYGPIPAGVARRLALDGDAPRWLRRLFIAPHTGELIAMHTRRRTFTPAQRRFLRMRDQTCRTPWCDAPIRHADHVVPADSSGPTTVTNGQGCCQACNHAKQAIGWRSTATPPGRTGPHRVEVTTPTGHRYASHAPDPPGRAA